MLTALIKGSIFVIGIMIIGILEPRTIITNCGSVSSPPVEVYQFPLWPHIEAYTDYRDLYIPCLINPFLGGQQLYHFSIVYNYPPLFVYLIAGFAFVANIVWLPALPLVLFDILTAIPVYLIAKQFAFKGNSRLAFIVAIFWAANPINLFYNDLMWLNTAPTTFFLVFAVYLFLKEEWLFSSLALAISTGLKQISVLLFPIFLIFLWRATGISKNFLVYATVYLASLVLISTPYLFNDTQNYFYSLGFPILGIPFGAPNNAPQFSSLLSDPVRITTFFGYAMPALVSESYQVLNYVFAGTFAVFLVYLAIRRSSHIESQPISKYTIRSVPIRSNTLFHKLANHLRNLTSRLILLFKESKFRRSYSANEVLVFCLASLLIFFSLFGRGVYKYYFASITPLGIPMFRYKFGAVIFEVISLVLFLAPREVTPWIAVLLITFIPKMLEVK
jgi:hypothetical protein